LVIYEHTCKQTQILFYNISEKYMTKGTIHTTYRHKI